MDNSVTQATLRERSTTKMLRSDLCITLLQDTNRGKCLHRIKGLETKNIEEHINLLSWILQQAKKDVPNILPGVL